MARKQITDEERAQKFIDSNTWIFAKTYAKTAPHEYVVYDRLDDTMKQEFRWFVQYIRDTGVRQRYFRTSFIYLYLGAFKYWTMGNPIEETTIINRANTLQF